MDDRVLDAPKIKLPQELAGKVSENEIVGTLLTRAMNKMEYYRSRCVEMQEKYGVDFSQFEEKFIAENEEIFDDGGDWALWQGYSNAFEEWKTKCDDLRSCLK